MAKTPKWDRHSIKAEVQRRGMTLTGIARDAGLYENACRQGLTGGSRPGAQAIADALDISFTHLFAGIYRWNSRHDAKVNNDERRAKGNSHEVHGQPVEAR